MRGDTVTARDTCRRRWRRGNSRGGSDTDSRNFDTLTRALSGAGTRRGVLGLLATLPILGGLFTPRGLLARKKRKKKKKVKFNAFGCVDVGKFCKSSSQCCSGICKGKKGKKACQAHDARSCRGGQRTSRCGGTSVACQTAGGAEGACETTTGKGPFCAGDGACVPCRKDADCTELCGAKAACVTCSGCEHTNGLACVGPEPESCSDPACPTGSICAVCSRDLDCVPLCGEGAQCIQCADCPANACIGLTPDSCIA